MIPAFLLAGVAVASVSKLPDCIELVWARFSTHPDNEKGRMYNLPEGFVVEMSIDGESRRAMIVAPDHIFKDVEMPKGWVELAAPQECKVRKDRMKAHYWGLKK